MFKKTNLKKIVLKAGCADMYTYYQPGRVRGLTRGANTIKRLEEDMGDDAICLVYRKPAWR